MDREARKANFKKLQLPGPGNRNLRKTRQSAKLPTISKYFPTPEKPKTAVRAVDEETVEQSPSDQQQSETGADGLGTIAPTTCTTTTTTNPRPQKRTKLDAFVLKDPPHDDFTAPVKKVKRAPKLSKGGARGSKDRNSKRQTSIKSAFLRNEELFAEIAAQHCMADSFDGDDVRLALAISKSEAETKGLQQNNEDEVVNLVEADKDSDSIRSKLERYGFRTANCEDYNVVVGAFLPGASSKRQKTKWANKFTALTLRNKDQQLKKLKKKVELLLEQAFRTNRFKYHENRLEEYLLVSSVLKECKPQKDVKIIRSSENGNSTLATLESYFVKELFPVTHLPAGHLLKDWSNIQGRDLTPLSKTGSNQEKGEVLDNVYAELERFFNSKKQLDFPLESPTKGCPNTDPNSLLGEVESETKRIVQSDINLQSSSEEESKISANTENGDTDTEQTACVTQKDSISDDKKELYEMDGNLAPTAEVSFSVPFSLNKSRSPSLMHFPNSCTETATNSTQKTRSTSPDLFADSDVEMEEQTELRGVEPVVIDLTDDEPHPIDSDKDYTNSMEALGITSAHANLEDKVESCSSPTTAEIRNRQYSDLQNTKNRNSSASGSSVHEETCSAHVEVFRKLYNKYLGEIGEEENNLGTQSNTKRLNKGNLPEQFKKGEKHGSFESDNVSMDQFSLESETSLQHPRKNTSATCSLSSYRTPTISENLSIDLTQSDSDNSTNQTEQPSLGDEGDEYLMLSDDEINYSIWRADKSKVAQMKDEDNDDFTLSDVEQEQVDTISEHKMKSVDRNVSTLTDTDILKGFSVLDLISKESSQTTCSTLSSNNIWENTNGDVESVNPEYLTTSSEPSADLHNAQSTLGMVNENSEPITNIFNTCSPSRALADVSFLCSPTEKSEPMKFYSRYSESRSKFNDLLANNWQSRESSVDFDEFDYLVHGSGVDSGSAKPPPEGIEQLLTAEIKFEESQKNSVASPTKCSVEESPSKWKEVRVNGKTYTVRYANTVKPDFRRQSEAQLLKQLYNFGVKPLKRKQAVKMLEYIYNQLHPLIMDDVGEEKGTITQSNLIESKASDKLFTSGRSSNCKQVGQTSLLPSTDAGKNSLHLREGLGHEMLRFSSELSSELSNEDYILQTNVTKKTARPLVPFHVAWYNLVCSNTQLHESILMYEPIDLQEIYLFLKTLGYRYDPKDLKGFFDRRCIIFRYDLATAAGGGNNRHVRKNKKSGLSPQKAQVRTKSKEGLEMKKKKNILTG